MPPRREYQVMTRRRRHSLYSLSDSSIDEEEAEQAVKLTPLQKLTTDMCKDQKTIKELIVGRRVGFYKVRGEIGYGTFSKVKLAFHALTRDKVALKVLDKTGLNPEAQRLLPREICNMENLQHPNVVRLYEVVETPSRLFLVMEYAGGGDLHSRICDEGKMSDTDCKIVFAQILCAMRHLHNNHVIHRDLKAENVLFTSGGCVKVADFGFSTCVSRRDVALDTFCGSPPYAAPELFRDDSYAGPPVDVWAMGVLLFFMATAAMPFRAVTMGKLRRAILDGDYAVPPWVPGPCQRLIKGTLRRAPADRYALDQMLGCEWLLPVEFPWAWGLLDERSDHHQDHRPPAAPSPSQLLDSEPGELDEEEEEVRASLEELGFTAELVRDKDPGNNSRSPVTGVYRVLLHRAQKRRGCETTPVVRGMVRDPKRESLRAYRGLRHSSKLCVVS